MSCEQSKAKVGDGGPTPEVEQAGSQAKRSPRRWLKLGRGAEINPITGGLRIDPDLHLPSRGMPVDIEFYYYSQDAHDGPFGYGRNMSVHRWILKDTVSGTASIYAGTGEVLVYSKNNGGYDPPAGVFDALNQAGDGSWSEIRAEDQVYFAYDVIDENGASRCTSINDLNGNTHTIVWDKSGPFDKLSKLIDAAGRPVYFNYDGTNRLSHMIDWGDRRQTFTYDADGNLNKVIGPTGCVTYYNYDANHNLTQLVDPEGYSTEWEYDDFTPPRVIRLTRPGDAHTYFKYSSVDDKLEVTIDALGNRTSYQWDANNDSIAETNPVGGTTSYEYSNRLVTLEIDPNGNRRTYQYDTTYYRPDAPSGNLITEISPVGGVTYYHYDSSNRVTVQIDPLEHRTSYTYDAKGNQTKVVDPLSRTTYYNYDAYGQRTMEVNALDKVTYYNYDAYGDLTQVIDALGNRTTFGYDSLGRQILRTQPGAYTTYYEYDAMDRTALVIDPLGNRTTYAYDGRGNRTIEIDANGNRTTYVYDGNSWGTAVVNALSGRTTYEYDAESRQVAMVDPLGKRTTTAYDAARRAIASIDPLGNRTTSVYDVGGRLIATVVPLGDRTTTVYDEADRQTARVDALGNRTTYVYDAAGNQIAVQDARGNRTTYVYDAAGQLTGTVDPQENRTTYVYDDVGQRTAVVNALGKRTTTVYDDAAWTIATVDALDNRTTSSYDSNAQLIAVEDPLNYITSYTYDGGRLVAVQDARGYRITYSYDGVGNRTAIEDARGNRSTFVYDAVGQMTALVDQLGQRTTYGYDAAGRQESRLDAKGQRTTYSYDDAGRQTGVQYSDGSRVTFSYDGADNRTKMEDSSGVTTYTYDEVGRPEIVTYPANKTVTYSYDEVGNRATMVNPDGDTTTYSYDSRNRLDWLINPHSERTTFVYDAVGRTTKMTHGNLTYAETDYDDASRIQAVRNYREDLTVLSIFTYSYDNAGNRTEVHEQTGDRVTWTYDEINQLTWERRSGGYGYDITYTYDEVGNRLTLLEAGKTTTYTYDAANQLGSEYRHPNRITYSYDANGNTDVIIAGKKDLTTYSWDIENRMTKVEPTDGPINTMTYDGDGKRRSYEDSAMLRKFIWDGENILCQTGGDDVTNRDYTYNPQPYGELISQSNLFHHYDGLGSTDMLTDSNRTQIVSYQYKAFGEETVTYGSDPNRFTWVGKLGYYRQPDTSDYWVRARVYRPAIGRWMSRAMLQESDSVPVGALPELPGFPYDITLWYVSEHRYTYANGDPSNKIDPSGWWSVGASCKCNKDLIRRHMSAVCGYIGATSLTKEEKKKLREQCRKAEIECDGYWCRFTAFGALQPPQAYRSGNTITLCSQHGGVGDTTWWYLAHELGHMIQGTVTNKFRRGKADAKADDIANSFQPVGNLPCTQFWFDGTSDRPTKESIRKKKKKKKKCGT